MPYDVLGAAASLLSTYYFIRLNNKAWFVGLLATCINGWLYWQKGIYADACLQAFYFFNLSYGWHLWAKKTPEKAATNILTRLSPGQWGALALAGGVTYTTLTYLLITFLHSNIASIDAFTTTLSLLSQWLMCHKVLLTWVGWFIVDALYVVIYLQKNLPFHAVLMLVYTGLAILGYLSWVKQYTNESAIPPPHLPMPEASALESPHESGNNLPVHELK